MRRLAITAALGAALTLLLAAQASASSTARMGIQDDAWLRFGPGTLDGRLEMLDGLGVKLVRFTVVWNEVARTKPRRRSGRTRSYRRCDGGPACTAQSPSTGSGKRRR